MVKPVQRGSDPGLAKAPPGRAGGPDEKKARAAIRGGTFAYFADQYDIYLPIITLAPAVVYFQSASLSPATTSLLSSFVFASTLIGRPLGALVFGHFADRVGRRRTTLIAVAGFGITTLAIACLPGHQTIGTWSIGLLIALRFVDGFFLGGEYTTAVPLAMEWSPPHKRGLYSSIITSTAPGAYVVIAAITLVLLQVIPSAGLDSAYVQWGWRIPFVIGAILAAILFYYYRAVVHEPPAERTGATHKVPFLRLLAKHPLALAQVFILMTGAWTAAFMELSVAPGQLASHLELSPKQVTVVLLACNVAATLSYPVFGILSQRIGRRRFYVGYGVAVLIVGSGSYALMMTSGSNLAVVIVWAVVLGVFTIGTFGPIAAYMTERFPASIRSTGYGVAYSFALIAPAFYEFYVRQWSKVVPVYLAPAVMIAIAGVLIAVGAALGPETRDVDMSFDDTALDHGRATA